MACRGHSRSITILRSLESR